MSYFREKNQDDFDRECAEGDAIKEAREARAGSCPEITPEWRAKTRAQFACLEAQRQAREAAHELERLRRQRIAYRVERAAHAYVRALDGYAGPFGSLAQETAAHRLTLAHLDMLRAKRQEAEAFRPVARESARREGLRAENDFINARMDYHRATLNLENGI